MFRNQSTCNSYVQLFLTYRKIFLHKLLRKVVDKNQVIVVENLAVSNMVKNHCLAKAI